ncbi:MAG: glycosyltransferase family 2 protein [Anaerolineales bacterium]|nr:glycosyltransferase family 2 protein [Anaerolineales bacterium]
MLSGFEHLRGTDFEVVVVNGPSTDHTANILENIKGRIKIVTCPSKNLSHSRNLGLQKLRGYCNIY